jgi:hypothetical protein
MDFQAALKILVATEAKMPRLFGGIGKGALGPTINQIIEFLLKYGDSSRSAVLRAFYQDLDDNSLDIVERTLERMNFIKVTRDSLGRDANYEVNFNWEK